MIQINLTLINKGDVSLHETKYYILHIQIYCLFTPL